MKTEKQLAQRTLHRKPILGLLFFALGVLLLVGFWDYSPAQCSWITTAKNSNQTPNLVGALGSTMSFWLSYLLGFGTWATPFLLFWLGYAHIARLSHLFTYWKYLLVFLTVISFSGILSMLEVCVFSTQFINNLPKNLYPQGLGGVMGKLIFSTGLQQALGKFGSIVILFISFSIGLVGTFTAGDNPSKVFQKLSTLGASALNGIKNLLKKIRSNALLKKDQHIENTPEDSRDSVLESVETLQLPKPRNLFKKTNNSTIDAPKTTLLPRATPVEKTKAIKPTATAIQPKKDLGIKIFTEEQVEKAKKGVPQKKGSYLFPPLSLLQDGAINRGSDENHQERADALVKTLAEFGVEVIPAEVHSGPVITRYDVTPAPGVRVEKIASLEKNIALGLKALSVRILAPVPGKGCVGVEIPNKNQLPVCLKDIIESAAWEANNAEIPIVLGKEVTGKPLVADLTKMPHLLIAGSTGAGKTVCINAIIASLLYHSSPEDLRFIMVDPKIVEMQLYNSLPHMLIPVVTEPKKVPGALKWLISEMERRYQIYAKVGVRNIAGFNAKILKDKKEAEKAAELESQLSPEERVAVNNLEVPRDPSLEVPKNKMPYIVCIIDELADLMMVAPADIETCIARLAQLARAAGIHLILATQRPSVNVITGIIKANLPCRIAFKVASKVDSRTILDCGGADQLIGRGDMLLLPPGSADLVRAQGAFVSDEEINAIIDFLKQNGPPQYAKEIQQQIDSSVEDGDDKADSFPNSENGHEDPLIPDALEVIRSSQRASTSMLQRRLKIGYNRAARIMELLEKEGYVGPDNGSQPREILSELMP